MKNTKNIRIKIVLSVVILLSVASIVSVASAASSSLSVSPSALTKNSGDVFNTSVRLQVSGHKVCAVEGTLDFKNLSCKSITLASGVTAQSAPSCSDPHFLVGIPNCTASDQTLLSVSVKAGNVGTASIDLRNIDIIGEGVSVGSTGNNGSFTINSIQKIISTITPKPKVIEQTLTPIEQTPTPKEQINPENNLAVASMSTTTSDGSTNPFLYLIFSLLVLSVAFNIYFFKKQRESSH